MSAVQQFVAGCEIPLSDIPMIGGPANGQRWRGRVSQCVVVTDRVMPSWQHTFVDYYQRTYTLQSLVISNRNTHLRVFYYLWSSWDASKDFNAIKAEMGRLVDLKGLEDYVDGRHHRPARATSKHWDDVYGWVDSQAYANYLRDNGVPF